MAGHHVLDIAELLTPDEADEPDGATSRWTVRPRDRQRVRHGRPGRRPAREAGTATAGTRPPAAEARHTAAPTDGPAGPSAADGPAAAAS